jgi:CDP-glucose 4,6-dehydratase
MSNVSAWRGRRVLVTGATGIVGSWVVKSLLERGATVVVLCVDLDPQSELVRSGDIHKVKQVYGSLEDYAAVERAVGVWEVDTVIHLGAQTLVGVAARAPLATFEANIRGTYHLLDACRVHATMIKSVVVASSDKAYGSSPELPYTEQTPLRAHHPYDVSKACTDLLAQTYHDTYGLPVLIARCGNIYGGGDLNWTRIVPGTIRSLLRGERPIIRSDGTFVRDYLYVKDAASAYLCLAEAAATGKLRGEAVNFGGDARRTVLEVVGDLQRLTGRSDLRTGHSEHREGRDSRTVAVVRESDASAGLDAGVHHGARLARDARLVPPLVHRLGACVTMCPVCSASEPAITVTREPAAIDAELRASLAGAGTGSVARAALAGDVPIMRVRVERSLRSGPARLRRRLRQRRSFRSHGSPLP